MTDARRRQWVAVSVDILHSVTGTKLQELGPGAVEAWVGLLAAAKRSPIEGTVSFVSESEAWATIGIEHPERLGFTLEQLLKTLGRQKQTKRTRFGRVVKVTVTHWEDWQKPRSGARNTTQKQTKNDVDARPDNDKDNDKDNDRYDKEAISRIRKKMLEANPNAPALAFPMPSEPQLEEERQRQKTLLAIAEGNGVPHVEA